MKITRIERWREDIPLTRPYTVAFMTNSSTTNVIVRVETSSGLHGLGAAAPVSQITGESIQGCFEALAPEALEWLLGEDVRHLPRLCAQLRARLPHRPAARAALDMALHDLLGKHLGVPVVEMLGRAHEALPTSITIGIKSTEEALAEADEYVGRGFRVLKVKLGHALEEDLERLAKLRERVGPEVILRVDPNQGYTSADVLAFHERSRHLDVEFLEQPMPADAVEAMRALPAEVRATLAADESLQSEQDALLLGSPPPACGIFNIKLMKCGGLWSARRIATLADIAGIRLMWGCMDESIISITAALHTALASPATRYLDLDGSFDLARDVAGGGFMLRDGVMSLGDAPGLGVELL